LFIKKNVSENPSYCLSISRITAVWGFSEAAFGGILHAFHIPLTGLFLGGAAVIFISLIAHYSTNKKEILKSTLTVIIIKALISPHTPLTAYLAVTLEGLLGYFFFSLFGNKKIATFLLSIVFLLYSSFQKLFILTIVFGMNFWKSIDEFTNYIFVQFNLQPDAFPTNFSVILITLYCGIHLIGAIYFSLISIKSQQWLNDHIFANTDFTNTISTELDLFINFKKKRKNWWNKPSGFMIILILIALLILSYTTHQLQSLTPVAVFTMLIRAIIITFLWFSVLSPFLLKFFNKVLEKKKFEMATEINSMMNIFPDFRVMLNYCWKINKDKGTFTRLKYFLKCSLITLLTSNYKSNG
jgi:hypothetical protein